MNDPRRHAGAPAIPDVLQFADCRIDTSRREVVAAGIAQDIAPRVYDLLLYLIEHRDRVVSKDELLEQVWQGSVVTESVIARAVMKARRAIGDKGDGALLKTVHRVGYRFAAALVHDASAAAPSPAPPGFLRVALRAFANETGEPAFDWIALGLPGLVAQVLQADSRLWIVDVAEVEDVMASMQHASGESAAEYVGVSFIVQGALRRARGRFVLAYRIEGDPAVQDEIVADEPAQAGVELAQILENTWFPDDRWPVRRVLSDPLAAQSMARAMSMSKLEQWRAASHLLQVVVDLEPESLSARLQQVRVLANLCDAAALPQGEALLARATQMGDQRMQAAAHEALGRACQNLADASLAERSRQHMAQALELAEPFAHEDWVVRIHLGLAIQAQLSRSYDEARRHYDVARVANRRFRSIMRESVVQANLAIVETFDGNPQEACELARQALETSERHGLKASAVDARATLALAQAQVGLLATAHELAQHNLEALSALPDHEGDSAAWALMVGADLEALTRTPGAAAQWLAGARDAWRASPRVEALLAAARGHGHTARGQWQEAADAFASSLALARGCAYLELEPCIAIALLETSLHGIDVTLDDRLAGHPEVRGTVLRREAGAALARGRPDEALAALRAAVAGTPVGRVNALSRIDAAWLLAERGEKQEGARIVRGIVPWLRQHPAGIALVRRFAQDDAPRVSCLPSSA